VHYLFILRDNKKEVREIMDTSIFSPVRNTEAFSATNILHPQFDTHKNLDCVDIGVQNKMGQFFKETLILMPICLLQLFLTFRTEYYITCATTATTVIRSI